MPIFFCWKNVRSFCSAKASLIFSTKNITVFCYKVVKHLMRWPLNELVKLTMLWTTGPRKANRKSQKLFPFVKGLKIKEVYSYTLISFNYRCNYHEVLSITGVITMKFFQLQVWLPWSSFNNRCDYHEVLSITGVITMKRKKWNTAPWELCKDMRKFCWPCTAR